MSEYKQRFKDAYWAKLQGLYLLIIGVGGIGTWTSLLLARTGIFSSIFIYDSDTVDKSNLGGQLFGTQDVGMFKVDSVSKMLREYCPDTPEIYSYTEKYLSSTSYPVVICCVDNMKTRRDSFTKWKNSLPDLLKSYKYAFFVDGRLLAERFQVYFVTSDPKRIEAYEKTLFSDDEVPNESCSYKSTSHFAAMISARITQVVTNYLSNIVQEDDVCEVPFSIQEEGQLFITTINK
jgi:hypothetical protein